ncbi:hypothetical protein BJ508DRAFT_49110 [Ascobolus immersus RN42]|uniref:Uncharacterized protein n=1 Tax=Ascobolus immersus RN42 TaxID=1160509 RepID=A0A3N4HN34_ASCIM|nr:hypothetical protein BJ508DRAFT_49110 [Ascobolus immersus RN42]
MRLREVRRRDEWAGYGMEEEDAVGIRHMHRGRDSYESFRKEEDDGKGGVLLYKQRLSNFPPHPQDRQFTSHQQLESDILDIRTKRIASRISGLSSRRYSAHLPTRTAILPRYQRTTTRVWLGLIWEKYGRVRVGRDAYGLLDGYYDRSRSLRCQNFERSRSGQLSAMPSLQPTTTTMRLSQHS